MAQSRSAQAPKVAKSRWIAMLHRPATRWDVLLHHLAEAMARRYWYTQAHFSWPALRLDADELGDAAMVMARAFGLATTLAAIAPPDQPRRPSLLSLKDSSDVDCVVNDGAAVIRRALLNYLETGVGKFIRRNHPDLEQLAPRIAQTLRQFILEKCQAGGDLHPCLTDPAGPDENYFPAPADAGSRSQSSGQPAIDAYRLSILVDDADGPADLLRKMTEFAKSDPFLGPEYAVHLVSQLSARQAAARAHGYRFNELAEEVDIRTAWLFSPSRQGGKLPAAIFAQRQLFASPAQKARLDRFCVQHLEGVFRLSRRQGDLRVLIDVSSQRELDVQSDKAIAELPDGQLIRARLLPWDEHWLIIGTVQVIDETSMNEAAFRQMLHPLNTHRAADEDDPRLLAGRQLLRAIHDQFVARFGGDLATFSSIEDCREAMAAFHYHLVVELILPDGRQFADAWRADVGQDFPAFEASRSGADEGELGSVGIICDSDHGMALLPDADQVGLALMSPFPDPSQKEKFSRLLLEQWRPGWLVEKVVAGNPDRAQQLIGELLGDDKFDITRDLPDLLGRLKCPNHTLPSRPRVFL